MKWEQLQEPKTGKGQSGYLLLSPKRNDRGQFYSPTWNTWMKQVSRHWLTGSKGPRSLKPRRGMKWAYSHSSSHLEWASKLQHRKGDPGGSTGSDLRQQGWGSRETKLARAAGYREERAAQRKTPASHIPHEHGDRNILQNQQGKPALYTEAHISRPSKVHLSKARWL